MLKKIILILGVTCVSSVAQAGPFSGSKNTIKPNKDCKYLDVYSASQKTFLILNLVEKLSLKQKKLKTEKDTSLLQAVEDVFKTCKNSQKLELTDVDFDGKTLSFEYGSGRHSVKWISKKGSLFVVYQKLYGTYKNEPLMVIKYKNQKTKPEFVRITGRFGPEKSNKRYTFFYKPNAHKKMFLALKVELQDKDFRHIKSLKSIYGKSEVLKPVTPLIKVGVIGTGLDYNHPGLAKHLAYRTEIEDDLQKVESLQSSIRTDPYVESALYESLISKYNLYSAQVGFPNWMDQALSTKTPYDSVIVNKKVYVGSANEHETRVTSRIVRTGGEVELHFVRRSMGSIDDLKVLKVIDNFAKKGVKLVNLSFGSSCGKLPREEKMWEEVFALYPNIVFVVSAGNSGLNTAVTPFCPAYFSQSFKNVISVTALDGDGNLAVYYDVPVNFGTGVDLAIKSNNLEVLIPYRKTLKWHNNANGATSLAAAEVSRILTEATLEGLEWNAQTVKEALVQTSDYRSVLKGVNKTASEVNEVRFKEALKLKMAL